MSSNHQVTTEKIKITAKQQTFDIKTSINPLIPGKFGPKNVIYSQSYDNQSRLSSLIIHMF